jgi:hypothetical protein
MAKTSKKMTKAEVVKFAAMRSKAAKKAWKTRRAMASK